MEKPKNTPELEKVKSKAFKQAEEIFSAIAGIAVLQEKFKPVTYNFLINGCPYKITVSREEEGTGKIVVEIHDEAVIKGAVSKTGPIVTDVIIPDTSLSRGEHLLNIPPVVSEELKEGDDLVAEIARKLEEKLTALL